MRWLLIYNWLTEPQWCIPVVKHAESVARSGLELGLTCDIPLPRKPFLCTYLLCEPCSQGNTALIEAHML